MSFAIVTDTSANLPSPLLRENQIEAIPFSYIVDGREFTCTDTEQFDGKAYYDSIRSGKTVTTSQITPGRYAEYLRPILDRGEDILYISMSSGISGSYASAKAAAAELLEAYPGRSIRLIDTYAASLGEGIFVLWALECRRQGMSLEDTADLLLARRKRMCQVFIVDDLMYLRRNGRVSNVSAIVGTVLGIRPILKGNPIGQIVISDKVRGRKNAIRTLADRYNTLAVHPETQTVGIAHADCADDAEYLAGLLRKNRPPKEILTVCYEPVTGSHVGPGTLALFFTGDDDVRNR